jgi:ABC-2 type transport system ATP-binding protein
LSEINGNKKTLVKFENVTKRFGNFTAVANLNLEIHEGEIIGLLGPNGAGKSTTMKMMAYLLRPTEGNIWIRDGNELQKLTTQSKDRLLDQIGFLIENPSFYEDVSPRQILAYFAELRGYPPKLTKKRVEEVVELMNMSEWIDKKISTFSKGMRQKIGIISSIVHDPQIVVLDEPQTGLDPKARIEIRNFISKLKALGKTIFLSSHQLYEVSELADRVAILSHGHLIAFDSLDNLEAKAKKSIIQLEIYPHPNGKASELKTQLTQILSPYIEMSQSKDIVNYNKETELFEIHFDGDPKNQGQIFKVLAKQNLEIISFSVPRAGLLEDIYLDLVNEGEAK